MLDVLGPDARSPQVIRVRAVHPHWHAYLLLDEQSLRVEHEGANQYGNYELIGETLTINWDAFGVDRFTQILGVYIQSSLVGRARFLSHFHNDPPDIARYAGERLTLLVHPKMHLVLDKVVVMLEEGLRQLGCEPVIASAVSQDETGRTIILGANFFEPAELMKLPRDSIVFNVENNSSQFLTESYQAILTHFHVWDYSESNAIELSLTLDRPVKVLPFFYVPKLSRLPETTEKDIDVFFFGSFHKRRQAVLDGLRARGLNVQSAFGVYGDALDQLIARSKVVINVHFYVNGCFEIIRVFDLLANHCAVVTELNPGERMDEDLAHAVVAGPYEQLVDVAEALVRDNERREAVAAAGFQALAKRSPRAVLGNLMCESTGPVIPSAANVGSGKSYDRRLFNIDIDARWQPDIVADITAPDLFDVTFSSPRFGDVRLLRGWFKSITVTDVLEHLPDLVTGMKNLLDLLADGGELNVTVPYDLSYGAWQDPTHVRAFNERSWVYYCEWHWYLNWMEYRFDLVEQRFIHSPLGELLLQQGVSDDEILRTPRAIDSMQVVMRKRKLTSAEYAQGSVMRDESRATIASLSPT